MDYPSATSFRSAGYADIVTNSSYNGGLVRQHGNVSFSRVFEAGHAVAAYQPETVYQIFQRSMFGKDVATGKVTADNDYSSQGPLSSWDTKNDVPDITDANQCYTYEALDTCTDEQLEALADGSAVIKDFIVQSPGGARLDAISGTAVPVGTSESGNGNSTGTDGEPNIASAFSSGGAHFTLAMASIMLASMWLV